jgi:hypothetical protein
MHVCFEKANAAELKARINKKKAAKKKATKKKPPPAPPPMNAPPPPAPPSIISTISAKVSSLQARKL